MKPDLEALLLALDALLQAGPDQTGRCEAEFERRLADTLSRYPSLTQERLLWAVHAYYPRWVNAQRRPPTLPPTA